MSVHFLCHRLYLCLLALLLLHSAALAQSCEIPVATAVSVQGTVAVQRLGTTQWRPVTLHGNYCPGDTIRVQDRSRADIALTNQAVIRLSANTTITLEPAAAEQTSVVGVLKGLAHFFSRRPRSLEVRTPFTVAGVRGTEFFISVDREKTLLSIFTGQVVAANEAGSLTLSSGQSAVAKAGSAPVLRLVAHPRDAVRWALYYPPVLYLQPARWLAGSDWQRQLGTSVEFFLQGDLQKAFASIENVPRALHEPDFLTYRASLLLAVGRVDEAGMDIQQALRVAPHDSHALALQTIIAVVQNENEKALDMAQQAVTSAPQSATAHIALSYAQQARFDLEGARSSLQNAVKWEPEHALAWARLAELQSSFGNLSQALQAAQKAVDLEPNLSRTQTVLGFAALMQVKTQQARTAFEQAIVSDQADPLPRLGLGLTKVRQGDVPAGRRDIEIAASLAPNNALIRSYLGKAYFEEKRAPLDQREYDVAKALDSRDPTPWFYRAIAKQSTNQPVEALRDMEQAIALNDNRAVYRSKLLLDADLAARSASIARIYSDLGFQPLALVEGWKSVNIDPTNYSAHRFLADSYAALPRHEIARVSELLQSQLLQPLNLTPIQPRLAESGSFLLSAQGPAALSFNEFNPLFNRDRLALQVSSLAGEHETWSGEGILSGIYKQLSFSAGYNYFQTDGFRVNNDQQDHLANVFVQTALTPQTSLQAEYRYRDRDNGDIELRFFKDTFEPFLHENTKSHTVRVGLRHAFSPGSSLLASYIYQDKSVDFLDLMPAVGINFFGLNRDETAHSGEAQWLFRAPPLPGLHGWVRAINVILGGGHFAISKNEVITAALDFPPPPVGPGPITDVRTTTPDISHTNLYLYSYISLAKQVTLTLGASGDLFDEQGSLGARQQANPKFGITWNPVPNTTLRAAAFRVLKRTLITDQTLEPTQVAGFNQFFDDLDATESWHYGGAIDQKISPRLYGGLEVSLRELQVPLLTLTSTGDASVDNFNWREYLGRAYLLSTPSDWLSLSIDYQYERFERDPARPSAFEAVTTHRVPVGLQVFYPKGWSTMLKATYLNQTGNFERPETLSGFENGNRDFWVFDTAFRYRLPKRYGFVLVGATNLFDNHSTYQATDIRNPSIRPGRAVFGRVTLALP